MNTFTADEILAMADEEIRDALTRIIGRVQHRGDGLAVYENMELGHPEIGLLYFMSYGSEVSQIETKNPPTTMPDIGGVIGWRYQLKGVLKR